MEKTTLDRMVAGGLLLALLIVFGLDKILPAGGEKPEGPGSVVTKTSPKARPIRMAIVQPERNPQWDPNKPETDDNSKYDNDWDNMGKLLTEMGEGFKDFEIIPVRELVNPQKLEGIDVLFLTCSSSENNNPDIPNRIREFVKGGGTLYASDWRYEMVRKAFPKMVDSRAEGQGKGQILVANIVDPSLQDAMKMKTVELTFKLNEWKVASFTGDRVKVLMQAKYKTMKENFAEAPLLVKFPYDKGSVIFTSFHNKKENGEVAKQLLKYLVFSALTAKIENEVNQQMLEGGFSPQKSNLLAVNKGAPEITQEYQSKKGGTVSFVLGFEDQGAKLKLTVVTPQGKTVEKEGTSTITIEESAPAPGIWRYTITALSVPFPNFPFTVTVGEK